MKKIAITITTALLALMTICACGASNDASTNDASSTGASASTTDATTTADTTAYEVDGVTYTLSSDWTYDQENKHFAKSGDSVVYEIVNDQDQVGQCTSSEERAAMYTPDSGIDTVDVTACGGAAVLTVEPVNEIKSCNLYFYKDGQEHLITYEVDFEDEALSETTQELIDSIS